MVKKKIFYSVLIALCFLFAASFAMAFGTGISAFADEKNFSIVFDDYDGGDMVVSRYEKVEIPAATFYERGVRIGKAETYVYDGEPIADNLVEPYRNGCYLFTETGEYSVVIRPIGYAAKGVDGGSKNLTFTITVEDGSLPENKIFPIDENLAAGLLCDFNEDFYLTDAFLDLGKAKIYSSEFPQVSSEVVSAGNNAIKFVKEGEYSKVGIYFGAEISETITDLSFISIKLKTNSSEVYFANLKDTAFYKMTDLAEMTLGDFSYENDGYQTVYISAKALNISNSADVGNKGVQLVFGGENDAFVCIDEIGFIATRKDYKFITNLKNMSVVETESYEIDVSVYFNGVKIVSPVCTFEVPSEYSELANVTTLSDKSVFNALKSGDAVLKVKYFENDSPVAEGDIEIHIKSFVEATAELVPTLQENEIVNWSTANYKYALQKSTLSDYTDDFAEGSKVNVGYNARYISETFAYGASTVIFPRQGQIYSDGYVEINCIFDNNTPSRVVKIYKYGETDPANAVVTFKAPVGNNYYQWYIPVAELTDVNGELNGIQVVNSSNWINLAKINYVPESEYEPHYVIYDNVSELALYENGENRTVSVSLERDGYPLNNDDYFIELTSSNESSLSVEGFVITPHVAGSVTLTVSYYADSLKSELVINKDIEIEIDTVANILSKTLQEGQLVKWDNVLYSVLVSDTTVTGRSMSGETYESFVNVNSPHGGYFYDYVPRSGNGSGRTITFPVQETYTDGYVKIRLTVQGNEDKKFASYSFVEIYKTGETNASNYILKATGDVLAGKKQIDVYVPVAALTDGNNVLKGVQIITAGVGWLQIGEIDYVAEADYTPTYTVTDNLSSIFVAEGGGEQTVTATLYMDGMILGNFYEYSITLESDNDSVATVDGAKITPVSSGTVNITLTVKNAANETIATDLCELTVRPFTDVLAETLGANELVNWDNALYENLVSDTAISSKSMTKETYTPVINTNEQFYAYVPVDSGDGTGRTIIFPVQNTYTDGYVKITVTKQGGNFPSYAHVDIYKVGETNVNNFVLKVTGNDTLKDVQTVDLYVPVSSLVDSENKLNGLQIIAAGTGWFRIGTISYVTELPD